MKKRFFAWILCLTILIGCFRSFAVAAPGETVFLDVKPSDWFFSAVAYVNAERLMNGVGDQKFDPNGKTTRGMIVTLLHRLEGAPEPSARNPFPDVQPGMWYTDAVVWASGVGVVNGYSDGKFYPDEPVTREQMAAIFYRYSDYKGLDLSAKGNLQKYTDQNQISDYALAAMSWANGVGLINGTSSTILSPKSHATRAEIATILMRYCENIMVSEPSSVSYFDEDDDLRAIVGEIKDQEISDSHDALEVIGDLRDQIGIRAGMEGDVTNAHDERQDAVYTLHPKVNGIPAEGNEVILLVDSDRHAHALYSYYDKRIEDVDTEPADSMAASEQAIRAAKQYLAAKYSDAFADAGVSVEDYINAHAFSASLRICSPEGAAPCLAWKIEMVPPESGSEARSVDEIDADTVFPMLSEVLYFYANGDHAAECIFSYCMSEEDSFTTSAADVRGNMRTFQAWRQDGKEYLIDAERGITTYRTMYGSAGFMDMHSIAVLPGEVISKNREWNKSGVSAHANISAVYDFYKEKLHRNSYDGNGSEIIVSVEYVPSGGPVSFLINAFYNDNAFWSPNYQQFAFYNHGDKEGALDVCAHEFTHAVINTIVGGPDLSTTLTYYGQSGALNEAYADIMGDIIEGKARSDSGRWLHGEDCPDGANRSAKSPTEFNYPAHYSALSSPDWSKRLDEYGKDRDHEGVHVFSSIFYHAAYRMMTDSRTSAVSDDDWAKLFYNSLFCLSENASFSDARLALTNTARLMEMTENEIRAIEQAFDDVGIPKMTETQGDEDQLRKEAYMQLIRNYETQYGKAFFYTWQDEQYHRVELDAYPTASGLYYANLIDLDRDGKDELILGYSGGSGNTMYQRGLDVWSYENGKAVKHSLSDNPALWHGVDGGSVYLADYSGERCIVTGSEMNRSVTLYAFRNGSLVPIASEGKSVYVVDRGYAYFDFGTGEPTSIDEVNVYGLGDKDRNYMINMMAMTKIRLGTRGETVLSEAELRSIAQEYGTIGLWKYADYDGNGTYEAFFLTVNPENGRLVAKNVYFIDENGNCLELGSKSGYSYNEETDCFRICRGKGFFWGDYGAGGSSWRSFLYSVKNGIPYELLVSDELQGFYQEGDVFYTLKSDFSQGYHTYPKAQLLYDHLTQQFSVGSVIADQ